MIKSLRLVSLAIIFCALVLPSVSVAELYKWRDSDGKLHVTDDLHKVPRKQRKSVEKVTTTKPSSRSNGTGAPETTYTPSYDDYEETRGVEIYGGESLEWWSSEFERLSSKIEWLENNNKNMQEYINVFEGGRRFGQVFGPDEVKRYEEYTHDLPEDKALLIKVKKELSKLKLDGIGQGVPEDIFKKKKKK